MIIEEIMAGWAIALLDLLESDFGQSGREVRLEAIKVELLGAYNAGMWRAAEICKQDMLSDFSTDCYQAICAELQIRQES